MNILNESLKEPAKEFFIDVSELALDGLLKKISDNTELLKDIPGIKWLFIGKEAYSVFQSAHFIKKWSNFIGQINAEKIGLPTQKELIKNLSKQDSERIIENTVLYLDRYQNGIKAKLLGELFHQTFSLNIFTPDEYNSLMFSVELLHPFTGIKCLKEFYEYRQSMEKETDKNKRGDIWSRGAQLDYSALSTSGLLRLPTGASTMGNLGGAYINDIGVKFYEKVVLNCIN